MVEQEGRFRTWWLILQAGVQKGAVGDIVLPFTKRMLSTDDVCHPSKPKVLIPGQSSDLLQIRFVRQI